MISSIQNYEIQCNECGATKEFSAKYTVNGGLERKDLPTGWHNEHDSFEWPEGEDPPIYWVGGKDLCPECVKRKGET